MNGERETTSPVDGWVGRMARLQPWYLLTHARGPGVRAAFTLIGGFTAIVILGVVAMVARWPLLFPSLGPTIFLVFFRPSTPESSPRNVMFGHCLGVGCGWLALLATGLIDAGPIEVDHLTVNRILAGGLSLATVSSAMVLLRCVHAPGISTALIVSLGMMTEAGQMLGLVVGAWVLCLHAYGMNRLAGAYYPLWRARNVAHRHGLAARALVVSDSADAESPPPRYGELANDLVTRHPSRGAGARRGRSRGR